MKLPAGWKYTPSERESTCSACGHTKPAKSGTLRGPGGREWPLIGNKGPKQESTMVEAIIRAHPPGGTWHKIVVAKRVGAQDRVGVCVPLHEEGHNHYRDALMLLDPNEYDDHGEPRGGEGMPNWVVDGIAVRSIFLLD